MKLDSADVWIGLDGLYGTGLGPGPVVETESAAPPRRDDASERRGVQSRGRVTKSDGLQTDTVTRLIR